MLDVNAEAPEHLLWHINLTPMEKAIDCVKLQAQPLTDGETAPTGLHRKLTGECHSRTFVRACTERVRTYHG